MTIELTDEELALCLIGVGRGWMEIQQVARLDGEDAPNKKPVWTAERRDAAKRSGRLMKKLMRSLAQSIEVKP